MTDTLREQVAKVKRWWRDTVQTTTGWKNVPPQWKDACDMMYEKLTAITAAHGPDLWEALEARVEQAEEDSLLMQGCNDVVIRDRAEDQAKLAKAKAREEALVTALYDVANSKVKTLAQLRAVARMHIVQLAALALAKEGEV